MNFDKNGYQLILFPLQPSTSDDANHLMDLCKKNHVAVAVLQFWGEFAASQCNQWECYIAESQQLAGDRCGR